MDITKQSEKQIVEGILKLKKNYEESTQDQRKEMADIFAAYMGQMDKVEKLPYKSQETVPKLRTEIAYVKPYIFSGEPEIEVEGVGDEDKTLSKILERIVNYRIQVSIPNAYGKIEDWVHQGTTFGTSLLLPVWRFETKKQVNETKVKDSEDEMGVEEPQEFDVVVRDEPDFEVPNILDCFYNPLIPEVEQQPCIIYRSILTVDEIKNNKAYTFVNEETKKLSRDIIEATGSMQVNQYDSSQLSNTDIPNAQKKATDGMVEVYEKVTKDRITTIAIGRQNLVLRDTPHTHGFINAVKFVFEKNTIPNRFNGLGVGHNTLGLGKMYHQMFNQTMDGVKLANNPMFMFAKGSGIDARQLVAKPGGAISVDTRGGTLQGVIQPIIFPDVKQGAVEIMTKLDDEHKRASGANDLVQGGASNATLGQDQIAQTNTSNRFELIQRRFRHALAEVGEMLIKLELENLQSIEAPILRIFPENMRETIFQLLTTEGQNVKYNVKVKGDTVVARNKQAEARSLVDLFNISSAIQTPQGPLLTAKEMRAFLRRIAEKQGEQNIDEIIGEDTPAQTNIDPTTGQPIDNQGMQQPQVAQFSQNPYQQ